MTAEKKHKRIGWVVEIKEKSKWRPAIDHYFPHKTQKSCIENNKHWFNSESTIPSRSVPVYVEVQDAKA